MKNDRLDCATMTLRASQLQFDPCDELAALCKAGGDALRLNVLRALSNDSFGVLELPQIFAIGQSGMSHHLKVLAQAGLVATRREGNAIFDRRALPNGRLHAALLDDIDDLPLPDDVQARIEIGRASCRERVKRSMDVSSCMLTTQKTSNWRQDTA